MTWLDDLTSAAFDQESFPPKEALENSLYYPASGTDGSPVRHWRLGLSSFVYVDTSLNLQRYNELMQQYPFAGYRHLGKRLLSKRDLVSGSWNPEPPPGTDERQYQKMMNMAGASEATAFAQWTVFERDANRDESHGKKRFSMLHIRGEGAATYQALYQSNNFLPKIVAIIRPGTGFGLNYSDFEETLWKVMKGHPRGMPPQLLYWHFRGERNQPPAPWSDDYDSHPLETMRKDGEPDFRISLFNLRKPRDIDERLSTDDRLST